MRATLPSKTASRMPALLYKERAWPFFPPPYLVEVSVILGAFVPTRIADDKLRDDLRWQAGGGICVFGAHAAGGRL